MSIITKIDSIPVFTTKTQALNWGRLNGYVGYREQFHFGKRGYIAGKTSEDIAFQKYPTQTATASLVLKNQQQPITPTFNGDNMTSYNQVMSSGGDNESGGSSDPPTSVPPPLVNQPPVIQTPQQDRRSSGGY